MENESDGIVDIVEAVDGYRITVQMPGWRKEEIEVDLTGSHVEISAQPRTLQLRNTVPTPFFRSISLDKTINRLRAEAVYRGDRLELHLPAQRSSDHGHRLIIN